MSLFDIIIIFSLGFFLGEAVTLWKLRSSIKNLANNLGLDISTEKVVHTKVVKLLRVEKIKDILYLYDIEDDVFVCQASSIEDLAKRVKEINYAHLAGVVDGDDRLWFSDGVVYKDLDEVKIL
jgi:hypothetical protein